VVIIQYVRVRPTVVDSGAPFIVRLIVKIRISRPWILTRVTQAEPSTVPVIPTGELHKGTGSQGIESIVGGGQVLRLYRQNVVPGPTRVALLQVVRVPAKLRNPGPLGRASAFEGGVKATVVIDAILDVDARGQFPTIDVEVLPVPVHRIDP